MIHLLCIQDSERRCPEEERSGARFEQRRSTREMTRWREKESAKVCAPVRTCLHFITSYEHQSSNPRLNRIRRPGGIDTLFACIYSSDARPIMPVYCETLSSFAPWLRIYAGKCVVRISRKIRQSFVKSSSPFPLDVLSTLSL